MLILGIETSCDDTSLALVEASGTLKNPRFRVLKNLVSSQIKTHAPFGGVVPNLAKREHLKNLPILYRQILKDFKVRSSKFKQNPKLKRQIDLIAVTVGPGLEPALWTGITFAQELREKLKVQSANRRTNIKIIGANHLEGHLYSFLLQKKTVKSKTQISNSKSLFPAISLIVSGGHTILLLVKDLTHWKKLGETRDDAAGEAFDKVARIMGLPYPGGPALEKLVLSLPKGRKPSIAFPRPMLNQKNYDFSFSGLKTAVLYFLREQKDEISNRDIAASFQSAAIDVLVSKTIRAAREFGARSIMLSGGVAANKALRTTLRQEAKKIGCAFFAPAGEYNTDNAAMIAVAGYFAHIRKKKRKLEAKGNLTI